MSLRTIQRTAIMSVLALGALSASGCDDDEKKDATDAGQDAGSNNGEDAGEEDAGPKPLMCGNDDDPCTDNKLGGLTLKACCTEGTDVCGLDTTVLGAVGVPFAGCYERSAPGVASEFCGGFFDMIDVKQGDKQFNLSIAMRVKDEATGYCAELTQEQKDAAINFAPCCTSKGECGVFIDNVEFMGSFNLQLGCVAAAELMPAPEPGEMPACTQNPATASRPTTLPYCNGESGAGECPEKLTALICENFKRGNIPCTVGDPTPDWVCVQAGLAKKGQAAPPVLAPPYCMEGLAEYVKGCGATPGATCIANVPDTIYGCVPVTAANPPALPEFLCGCGDGKTAFPAPADKFPCLANVDAAVCGTIQQTTPIAQMNAFNSVCGCGPNTKFNPAGLPCWSNVETTICGATPAPTVDKANVADTKCVPNNPEILLGCGPGTTSSYPPTCIPNAATTVGGCIEVTAGSPFLMPTSNAACGCGAAVRNATVDPTNAAFCLSYVEETVCGANPVCATVNDDCDPDGAGAVFGPEGGTCQDNEPTVPDGIGDRCVPKA